MLLPAAPGRAASERLDIAGAVTVTASLMLAVYAIVNGNEKGWTSAQTLGLLGRGGRLLAIFLAIESRVAPPLMPLGLFRLRNVATANVVGVLWAAAMFAWFFLSALYLQFVLGLQPAPGRARLPSGQPDHGQRSRSASRPCSSSAIGLRAPLATGLALARLGLCCFRAGAGRRQTSSSTCSRA